MMSTAKDMRRSDLAVPYVEPPKGESSSDLSGTMSSTLPMAAMFTRNKSIAWAAVTWSLSSWLGESADQKKNSATPGYFGFAMSVMAVFVTYLPLFLPPPIKSKIPSDGTPSSSPSLLPA